MELSLITLKALQNKKVGILGYGNQGRAHALNLRDSGIEVAVGCRSGRGFKQAQQDGFLPLEMEIAAEKSQVLVFLLPDQVIPEAYDKLACFFKNGEREVGFSHGYAYQFGGIKRYPQTGYFLVGPKGAGAILREKFVSGEGLPGVFAVESPKKETREVCLAYAKAIGLAEVTLLETSFKEETECDLFGEQAVLCGGIMELMEAAFDTLVKNGNTPEMAFFECCYEAIMILELWMKFGPEELSRKISPTAFFGGLTRGRRIINSEAKKRIEEIFQEIRSGQFQQEWREEVKKGYPQSESRRRILKESPLEKTYQILKSQMGET
jgi:ketol-acid reductoisomerase